MRKDNIMRIRTASLLGAAALSVSACAASNGAYRPGYAYGYGPPNAFGCADGTYDGYGVYGLGYCGCYDGFFYPGFGNSVFDRHHHRREMTSRQHDYFTRQAAATDGGRRVGLGSSGGTIPPAVSGQQSMPRNGGVAARGGSSRGGMRGR